MSALVNGDKIDWNGIVKFWGGARTTDHIQLTIVSNLTNKCAQHDEDEIIFPDMSTARELCWANLFYPQKLKLILMWRLKCIPYANKQDFEF